MSCRAEHVRMVRRAIREFAESIRMPAKTVDAIEVATSEAVANAVRHAYKDATCTPIVEIKCCEQSDGLVIEIADKGCGFSPPPAGVVPTTDFNREGGLGIILMKRLMDSVDYTSRPDRGTRIRMFKSFARRRPAAVSSKEKPLTAATVAAT